MHSMALREGVLFPRWSPEFFFGYGYPLFNFYAPLSSLGVGLLHLLGLTLPDAVELAFALASLLAAVGMYRWLREHFGPWGAVAAAGAYSFAPYHIVDVYLRGGLPEFVAMALLPWVLWGIEPGPRPWPRRLVRGSLPFATLILTHNVTALVFAPVALVYALLPAARRRWRDTVLALISLGLGVALAAFFWIPALAELDATTPRNLTENPFVAIARTFQDRPVSLDPIQRYASWENGEFSYAIQLGLFQGLLATMGMAVGMLAARRAPVKRRVALLGFAALGFVASVWLLFPFSLPVWERIPLAGFVQYPWRMLAPAALFAATLVGAVPAAAGGRAWLAAALLAVLLMATGVAGLAGLNHREVEHGAFTADLRGAQLFESMTDTIGTTSLAEYVPAHVSVTATSSAIAMDRVLGRPPRWLIGDVAVFSAERRTHQQRFVVRAPAAATVALPIVDFPGWTVRIDGAPVEHGRSAQLGLLEVDVPAGEHVVEAVLGPTPPRVAGEAISWVALATLVAVVAVASRRRDSLPTAPEAGVRPQRAWLVPAAALVGLAMLALSRIVPLDESLAAVAGGRLGVLTASGLSGTLARAGDRLTVEATWTGSGPPTRLDLVNGAGQTVAAGTVDPAVTTSTVGGVLQLPEALAPGGYRLRLTAVGPAGEPLPLEGQRLGRYWLPGRAVDLPPFSIEPTTGDPVYALPVVAENGFARLAGATLTPYPVVTAGEGLVVDLVWQVERAAPRNLVVFLHLLTGDGRLVAQRDAPPGGGAYPTTAWVPGTSFRDRMVLPIPAGLAPGDYRLMAGMYDAATVRRIGWTLPGGGSANILSLTNLRVAP